MRHLPLSPLVTLGLMASALGGAAEPSKVQLDLPPLCLQGGDGDAMAWVAICEMVIRHQVPGSTHQLRDLLEAGYGPQAAAPDFRPRKGLSLQEIQRVLREFGVLAQPLPGAHHVGLVEAQLRKGRPVIVQLTANAHTSRLVLIRGLEYRRMAAMRTVMGLSLLPGGGAVPTQEMVEQEVPLALVNDPLKPKPSLVNFLQLQTFWAGGLSVE